MRRRRSTPIYHRPIAARSSWLWLDACVTVLNSSNVSARSRWPSSLDPGHRAQAVRRTEIELHVDMGYFRSCTSSGETLLVC